MCLAAVAYRLTNDSHKFDLGRPAARPVFGAEYLLFLASRDLEDYPKVYLKDFELLYLLRKGPALWLMAGTRITSWWLLILDLSGDGSEARLST